MNPPVTLNVSGQTPDVKVNIPTSFNFNVDKSNYTGKLFFQITQEPAGSGKIKIGGKDYDMGKVEITDKNSNVVEFTPLKTGATILKLVVTDEWGKSTIKRGTHQPICAKVGHFAARVLIYGRAGWAKAAYRPGSRAPHPVHLSRR